MNGISYTREQEEFLIENMDKYSSYRELTEIFNKKFGQSREACNIAKKCRTQFKKRLKYGSYTDEQNEFLKQVYPFYPNEVVTATFNMVFNEYRTEYGIRSHCNDILNLKKNSVSWLFVGRKYKEYESICWEICNNICKLDIEIGCS